MPRTSSNAHGVILARLMLEMIQVCADLYFESRSYASDAGDVVLCVAIWLGQTERRPMTAAKLASFIGMPRPTVIRRLQALKARELVAEVAGGKWRLKLEYDGNDIRVANIIAANMQHLRNACAKASKVDSKPIASSAPG